MLKVGYGAMVLESLLAVLALCVAGAAAAADGTPAAGTPFQVFSSGVAGFFEMFGIPVYIAQCFMTMCVSALALTSLDAVARIGYANIWPLFGSANQLLSALVERTIGLVKAYAAGSATFRVEGLQLIIAILLMALYPAHLLMTRPVRSRNLSPVRSPGMEYTSSFVMTGNGFRISCIHNIRIPLSRPVHNTYHSPPYISYYFRYFQQSSFSFIPISLLLNTGFIPILSCLS